MTEACQNQLKTNFKNSWRQFKKKARVENLWDMLIKTKLELSLEMKLEQESGKFFQAWKVCLRKINLNKAKIINLFMKMLWFYLPFCTFMK